MLKKHYTQPCFEPRPLSEQLANQNLWEGIDWNGKAKPKKKRTKAQEKVVPAALALLSAVQLRGVVSGLPRPRRVYIDVYPVDFSQEGKATIKVSANLIGQT